MPPSYISFLLASLSPKQNKIVTKSGRNKLGNWNWHIHTTIYKIYITNKDLVYVTRNSTQYSVMTYMGKQSKKRLDICIRINDSLWCTSETNTTVLITYMPI